MIYRLANIEDIEGILALHRKYQIDTIKEEDKKDGFCNYCVYKRGTA